MNHQRRTRGRMTQLSAERSQPKHEIKPATDLMEYVRDYARERPEAFALTCIGIGFVLGWRLKPW